jgi:hypothetical protein
MDSTGAHLAGIITVNKLFQVWQERRDPEPTSYYEDLLTVIHRDILPVGSTEQHQGFHSVSILGMI